MSHPSNLNVYLNLLSLIGIAVVGFYAARAKVKNENIKDLILRVDLLEKERNDLKTSLENEKVSATADHLTNQKAIAKLEGQVELYKDLQLESIATHLTNLDTTNAQILDTLQGSAEIAKTTQADGGLLVKTSGEPLQVETKENNPLDVKPVKEKK